MLSLRVHDNASTDNTSEVVSKWQQRLCGRLVYQRHESNLGLVGNYLSCIKSVSSEYVWVMGDDDVVNTEAIDRIWAVLDQEQDYRLIAINYRPVDGITMEPIAHSALPIGLAQRFPDSRDCFEACFRLHYGSLMFITACIYSTKSAVKAISEFPNPAGNLAFPFYVAGACAGEGSMYVLDEVCFDGHYNVGSWRNRSFEVFFINLPEVLIHLMDKHAYGKGLIQPHIVTQEMFLRKPYRYLIGNHKFWITAKRLSKKLVSIHGRVN